MMGASALLDDVAASSLQSVGMDYPAPPTARISHASREIIILTQDMDPLGWVCLMGLQLSASVHV